MASELTIAASAFAEIEPAIQNLELDFSELLAAVDIARDDLMRADALISLNSVVELFEIVAQRVNNDSVGARLALAYPEGSSGVLGYLILNAATVRQSLLDLVRYTRLVTPGIGVTLDETGTEGVFRWHYPDTLRKPNIQYVSLIAGIIIPRIRLAAGKNWCPLRTAFEFASPKALDAYAELFGANVEFETGQTSVTLTADVLDLAMPDADARLHGLIQELGDYRLSELAAASDVVNRTQDQIIALLGLGPISLEQVARDLGFSSRSLQRHLRDEGTTFQIVLEKTRRMMTRHYLRQSTYSLTQIAFMLGFSEQSAFTRACKRWFKKTPQELRRSLVDA